MPLKDKLGDSVEKPRYLEAEGYYVGRRPYVTTRNRNIMENRLIQSDKNVIMKKLNNFNFIRS